MGVRMPKENLPNTSVLKIRSILKRVGLLAPWRKAKRCIEKLRIWVVLSRLPDRTLHEVEVEGVKVSFRTEDSHSRIWFGGFGYGRAWFRSRISDDGLYEPPVTKELVRRIKDAETFADVGGHLGHYSCIAAATNPAAKIFCFEMNKNLVPKIQANVDENSLNNVSVVHTVVTDRGEEVSYRSGSLINSLSIETPIYSDGKTTELEKVKAIKLDDFFAEQGIMPGIIKIDVEGAEMNVLNGCRNIINKHHPVLFIEIHPGRLPNFGATIYDVYNFLKQNNYSLFNFPSHRVEGELLQIPSVREFEKYNMVLCQ